MEPPEIPERPSTEARIKRPYPLPSLPPDRRYVEPADPASVGGAGLTHVDKSDPFNRHSYRLSRVVHRGKTAFQNVLIADTYSFGRIFVLDGALQSACQDESLYHELLVQPAMLGHHEPRDVLIIGGGEGATLREVLVHRSVRSATMVDLDREVVDLCREHLTHWHRGAFDDPRVELAYGDGRKFVSDNDDRYDIIVIDVVDMLDNGPAQSLYTRQFYELLKRRLRPEGIVVVQGMEFSFLHDKPHAALARTLRTAFREVHSYSIYVPSFFASWGFLSASDWFVPAESSAADYDRRVADRLGDGWLKHLTGDLLRRCFTHGKETLFLLSQPGPVLEDGEPFVPPPDIRRVEPAIVQFPIPPRK